MGWMGFLYEPRCVERASRGCHGGTSFGLVPSIRSGTVGRFTGELIWGVQVVGNLLNSVGRRRFRGVKAARRLAFKRLLRRCKHRD